MKPTVSKKDVARKRVTVVLAVVCCLSILVGTLAFFTDRVNQTTTSLAGTLDLVFNDISASRSGTNGILSPNEFAIDGVWGRTLVQENSIINPGDYFDLSYNLSNVGSKSMDVKHRLTLESTVPLTGNEYTLNVQGVGTIPGTLSADGRKLTYDLPEFILNGTGTGAETEAGVSGSSRDFVIRLDLNAEAGNALQGAGVTVTLDSQAKQHRNTDDNVWVDWAEYKIGVEQTGGNYNPELVPMLAPNSSWFAPSDTSIKRASITEIEIVDSYTPTGEEDATWDASDPSVPGTVTAYVEGTKLTIAGNGYGCVYTNPDSTSAFSSTGSDYFSQLTTFTGASLLNTSKTTNMGQMFRFAKSLKTVDLSKWDTSKVTSMRTMFSGNASNLMALETLDVSNWDTSSVTDMAGMFQRCPNLQILEVGSWDTGNVTSLQNTFKGCSKLTNLDVGNWDTSNVTNMSATFSDCSSLVELDVSNWDTSNVQDFYGMFSSESHAANMKLTELDVENWDTSSATDMGCMFYGCSKLTSLNIDKWDVSKVTNMEHMFCDCKSLTSINLAGWETDNVRFVHHMFNSCESLTVVDVSNWNTSKVESFTEMFVDCHSLETIIGIESFDTSMAGRGRYPDSAFGGMFMRCFKLTSLDLSGFDTSNATNTEAMFRECGSLKTIYVGDGWDMSNVTKYTNMFYKCYSLVGGAGSAYATLTNSGKTYAKVDGGPSAPGYLTYKAAN